MKVEIVRDLPPRWCATDENSLATGYGGTVKDALMQWADNCHAAIAQTRHSAIAQSRQLDASVG